MKVHTSVLVICLILAVVCSGAIQVLHHDRLDGFVANEHIDWTTSAQDFNTTGDITLGGYIDIPEMTIPGTPGTNYLRLYNEDIHGFSFFSFKDDTGMVRKLVRDSVIVVKNERGSAIAAGRIVYATGSENTVPTVDLAKADSEATMPAIGVTLERIVDGAYGRVMQTGLLENVNTNSFSAGDVLYVSDVTAGTPKNTIPVTPSLKQEIGTILVSDSNTGSIQIVSRSVHQNETGTAQNTFLIGDGTSDGKTLTFNAITDGSIIWDETKFDLDGAPLYTSDSGRFDGGVGVGIDPTAISLLNIIGGHADRTAIRINNTSTGNPVVQFALSSTVKYVMGIDDSDSDKFKISSGTTLGVPTLIMDSAINLSGIGTITSSGAYNTLHIVEGTTASHPVWANYACLSGDGTEHDGLSIQIPYTAGNDFYYGYGGTEDHYFGQSSNLQITSDGNIATAGTVGCGTITATANSDVLLSGTGHVTSGSEGFIVGTLTVSDGSIDDTDGSIAFGATNFTGVGSIDVNSIEIVDANGEVKKAAVEDSGNWDAAYTHIGESGASHSLLGATPGTVSASLAVIVDANNDIDFGAGNVTTDKLVVGDGVYHLGDLDTNFWFLNNRAGFYVGGMSAFEAKTALGAKVIFNPGSGDMDVQIKGDTDDNLFYANAGTDRVGIGTNAPAQKFTVNGITLLLDKLAFTQTDLNEYIDSLADSYVDIGATTAIRLNGLDDTADPKLIFVSDNEGSVTWMEDERYFLLDNALVAVRDDWIPPYISLQSTLSIAQSGGYTPMFESRMDTDGADVETRLESTDALGRMGTNSAHDLDLITNSAARMTISAAGYVRVINRMMIGADAAPDYPLEVTGISRLGDGGATNYTQFAADGTQTMAGTAKVMVGEDIDIAIPKRPTANPPAEGTEDGFPTLDFDDGTDESILIVYHLKQNYASAGTFHVHVDYFVDTAPVGDANVVWGLEYKKQSHGDNFDFDAGSSTLTTTEAVTTGTPANNKKIHETTNFNLTTTGWVPHDIILMRLYRDANNLNDNFTGDARLIHIHVEFLSDKLGEAT